MQQTTVQLIFENWRNMSQNDFNEFMLNQEKTLLREEKELILDAYNSCLSRDKYTGEFVVNTEDYESAERYWSLIYENSKIEINNLKQSTLF
jgi:hypothetical protein